MSARNKTLSASLALALLLCALPGGATSRAADDKLVIKVATMVPRTPEVAIQEKRYNLRLAEETQGRIQFRTYWGGAAGDDTTVMRKMRTGQIDAAPLGVDIVSRYARQCTVLMAPQTFFNYKQIDAVRKELSPEFDGEAYANGFKVISWWDAGRVRIFSQAPIQSFEDLRRGRPWLYPASALLKEFYNMIEVTGVPLDLSEVYAGLQTGMIDTVWISPVLATAFRWSSHTQYMSRTPVNIVQGAFLLRLPAWEAMKAEDRAVIEKITAEQSTTAQARFRDEDERAYKRLLGRGMKEVDFQQPERWREAGSKLRTKMVGRTYSKETLARVEAITSSTRARNRFTARASAPARRSRFDT